MNETWSLDALYKGYDDPKYEADIQKMNRLCEEYEAFVKTLPELAPKDALRKGLLMEEELTEVVELLILFSVLQQQANTKDAESASRYGRVWARYTDTIGASTQFRKYVAGLDDLETLIASDDLLQEYAYLLRNIKKDGKYLLSEREETILAKMSISGADAWEELQGYLTSSVPVSYRGEETTLSEVRNLAYDPDPSVRKDAYEAELACYDRIKDSVAFSLNSIKLQTINECKLRGYDSALHRSLYKARMKRETLDAMWSAIDEYLPKFWEYLRVKAEALGHKNGMPWYDMFAPMGKNDRVYSIEEARDVILELFGSFDSELLAMGRDAFDNAWIDFFPREGKVGGAFCQEISPLHQSRVLTNFGGSYSDIVTLAHELGHAFHNYNLNSQRPLNKDYSMPVAETASTFNENIVNHAAYNAAASDDERLSILESQLMDACQIICDIYSRYLFETAVFERREADFLPADELCSMMLDAQKKAYGTGLDAETLHPYMWLCKSHYYSGGLSFYNFPYAFGGLFARGLYTRYQKEGESFVPKYKALLRATPVADAEDAAKIAGIDLTDKQFWRDSLASIAEDIDEFIRLVRK
ncbi:MAG: M3 family oligoendopeptidase [Clostridia bacterium]|nr:M3 family oligoendopeptidase [Clostridia bacterium]